MKKLLLPLVLLVFLLGNFVNKEVIPAYEFVKRFDTPIKVIEYEPAIACQNWSWVEQVKAKLSPNVLWDNEITIGATLNVDGRSALGNTTSSVQTLWVGPFRKDYIVIERINLRADLNCDSARFVLEKELVGAALAEQFKLSNPTYVLSGPYENLVFADGLAALYIFGEWDGVSILSCAQLRTINQLSTSGYFPVAYSQHGFSILPGGIANILAVNSC